MVSATPPPKLFFPAEKRVAMLPDAAIPSTTSRTCSALPASTLRTTAPSATTRTSIPTAASAPAPTLARETNKFEGKERDKETCNDDFSARSYSCCFGRWLGGDWSDSHISPTPSPPATLDLPRWIFRLFICSCPEHTSGDCVQPHFWLHSFLWCPLLHKK
jgi:hypothetical protein